MKIKMNGEVQVVAGADPGRRYRIAATVLLPISLATFVYFRWIEDGLPPSGVEVDYLVWFWGSILLTGLSLWGIALSIVLYVIGQMVSARSRREAESRPEPGTDPGGGDPPSPE